jgi:hypothetical protein
MKFRPCNPQVTTGSPRLQKVSETLVPGERIELPTFGLQNEESFCLNSLR